MPGVSVFRRRLVPAEQPVPEAAASRCGRWRFGCNDGHFQHRHQRCVAFSGSAHSPDSRSPCSCAGVRASPVKRRPATAPAMPEDDPGESPRTARCRHSLVRSGWRAAAHPSAGCAAPPHHRVPRPLPAVPTLRLLRVEGFRDRPGRQSRARRAHRRPGCTGNR